MTAACITSGEFVQLVTARLQRFRNHWEEVSARSPGEYPSRLSEEEWLEVLQWADWLRTDDAQGPRNGLRRPEVIVTYAS